MVAEKNKYSLWFLAWPIFVELLLQLLLGAVDTLMVSRVSDDAVAVVGLANQIFQAVMILFTTVASGAGILIAQKLGAKQPESARTVGIMAVTISGLIGAVLSVILYVEAVPLARLFHLEERLLPLAHTYISIVGSGMVLTALTATMSTTIRNTGNTKGPMITAIGMNIVHVVMNYGWINGAFGFPQLGLTGVAISTLISRLLATCLLIYMFVTAFERRIRWRDLWVFNRNLFREIIKIGWPLGVNMSSWVLSQLAIYSFLATMGATALAARTYMNTLESICFMLGYSIALSAQIQIAHLFGSGQFQLAYKAGYRATWIGLGLVGCNSIVLLLIGHSFLGLFTSDTAIIQLALSCLVLTAILQPGRMINMGFGNALNAIGDTRYNMVISLISMWGVAAGLSYVLGLHYGWGLAGIYVAMLCDEYLRGILVAIRWRKKKYLRMAEGRTKGVEVVGTQESGEWSVHSA
ncbi:MATE family efflux transporter [Paenibacillus pectinilyticus]|uniref:MATE family efflux transporter n=1 Tax=Paenibacillus pectinilyticus TaxID=512399 RepID=A0A1C0ZT03_9BACL|nr:MATE family efflux transporter [Paenibacillus pectinilyticus]OCT11208.1 MATE family efflux transporter [Paenibacillus pectinilyticus]